MCVCVCVFVFVRVCVHTCTHSPRLVWFTINAEELRPRGGSDADRYFNQVSATKPDEMSSSSRRRQSIDYGNADSLHE